MPPRLALAGRAQRHVPHPAPSAQTPMLIHPHLHPTPIPAVGASTLAIGFCSPPAAHSAPSLPLMCSRAPRSDPEEHLWLSTDGGPSVQPSPGSERAGELLGERTSLSLGGEPPLGALLLRLQETL